jgi:hypothetical protein
VAGAEGAREGTAEERLEVLWPGDHQDVIPSESRGLDGGRPFCTAMVEKGVMHDVWPVLFIANRSKAQDALKALKDGTLSAAVASAAHIRRGAQFILALEDGRILGTGEVVKAFKEKQEQELSVRYEAASASAATALPKPQLDKLKALLGEPHLDKLKTLLGVGNRPPFAAFVIPTDGRSRPVDVAWFDEVTTLVEQATAPVNGSTETVSKQSPSASESEPRTARTNALTVADRELLEWLPPRLSALVTDDARAEQWETLVTATFRALGLTVDEIGQKRPGEPVPDCIARYEGNAGTYVLVIDAKRGEWNAPADALRAMRDYLAEFGGPRGYPVFVVGRLGRDARQRLAEAVIGHADPVAITGRQLADLLVRKLTHPELSFEAELRQLLRSGRG